MANFGPSVTPVSEPPYASLQERYALHYYRVNTHASRRD